MIRVELHQQGLDDKHATVKIFDDRRMVTEVIAKVQSIQGADGKMYPNVHLEVTK
ncbi:MAG: hypothetical protein MN733_04945 [Nitrososphaera sp.]|nr:hypothetical protein [Nitrososphaera sp.]